MKPLVLPQTSWKLVQALTISIGLFFFFTNTVPTLGAEPGSQEQIAPGTIVNKVVCREKPDHSYALYLPSNYSPDRAWPILYCFDPDGRGANPVERFKRGAETYGFILAGSNNSHNGPGVDLATIIAALLDDTQARFKVDERQVYATGFSGGGRVACSLANAAGGRVAGVIACSGGFPGGIAPTTPLRFAIYATAGTEDFNYSEMVNLTRALEKSGTPTRLHLFEGSHAWAPEDICEDALSWMAVLAMKSGVRKKDEALIADTLRRSTAKAEEYEKASQPYDAYREYLWISREFTGVVSVESINRKIADLQSTKAIKDGLKLDKDLIDKQEARTRELYAIRRQAVGIIAPSAGPGLSTDALPSTGGVQPSQPARSTNAPTSGNDRSADHDAAMSDLKRAIADLKRKSAEKTPSPDRALARRILSGFFAESYESSIGLLYDKNYPAAVANLIIATEIRPDSPYLLYMLARSYALNREKGRAIETLKKAVQKGFKNTQELETSKDFDSLRKDKEFAAILQALKGQGEL